MSYIRNKSMKRILVLAGIAAIVTLAGFDFASGVDSFTARPDGDGITLEWHSEVEAGISRYSVQRADINSPDNFQDVGDVSATGNYSYYKFHDSPTSSIGIAAQGSGSVVPSSEAYRYRLEINLTSGDISYSQTVNVTKPSSGVRRTWGMIKEMFH